MHGFREAACNGGCACHAVASAKAGRSQKRIAWRVKDARADRIPRRENQISLHIRGRVRRPLLLSESQVPGFRR